MRRRIQGIFLSSLKFATSWRRLSGEAEGVDGFRQFFNFLRIVSMYYVYIIRSIQCPENMYVGFTTNLEVRLQKHNDGSSFSTARYKPWKLVASVMLPEKKTALQLEKYLKSHSGRAFFRKRFC